MLAIALVVGLTFRSLRRSAPDPGRVGHRIPRRAAGSSRGSASVSGRRSRRRSSRSSSPSRSASSPTTRSSSSRPAGASSRRARAGSKPPDAPRTAVAPIVATAGLIVVAGTFALVVGELEFFRAFGPALALTAGVALAVSITFVPAALGLFGRMVFWPSLTPRGRDPCRRRPPFTRALGADRLAHIATGGGARGSPHRGRPPRRGFGSAGHRARPQARKRPAAGLGGAASRSRRRPRLRRRGAGAHDRARSKGAGVGAGAGGSCAPRGRRRGGARRRRGDRSARAAGWTRLRTSSSRKTATPRGSWSILDAPPLDSEAIKTSRELDAQLPAILQEAGLAATDAALTGQTAVASDTVEGDRRQLGARRRRRARAQLRPARPLPPGARRTALPARGQRPLGRGDARADHVRLPGASGPQRPHLLRPLRGRRAPGLARVRLQRLRRRTNLAGGRSPPAARGDRRRRPARVAIDQRRRHRAGRLLRHARDRPHRRIPRASPS